MKCYQGCWIGHEQMKLWTDEAFDTVKWYTFKNITTKLFGFHGPSLRRVCIFINKYIWSMGINDIPEWKVASSVALWGLTWVWSYSIFSLKMTEYRGNVLSVHEARVKGLQKLYKAGWEYEACCNREMYKKNKNKNQRNSAWTAVKFMLTQKDVCVLEEAKH